MHQITIKKQKELSPTPRGRRIFLLSERHISEVLPGGTGWQEAVTANVLGSNPSAISYSALYVKMSSHHSSEGIIFILQKRKTEIWESYKLHAKATQWVCVRARIRPLQFLGPSFVLNLLEPSDFSAAVSFCDCLHSGEWFLCDSCHTVSYVTATLIQVNNMGRAAKRIALANAIAVAVYFQPQLSSVRGGTWKPTVAYHLWGRIVSRFLLKTLY